MKISWRLAVLAALCGTVALAGWVAAGLADSHSLGTEGIGTPREVSRTTAATVRAEHVDAPRATALSEHDVSVPDMASGSTNPSDPGPMPRLTALRVLRDPKTATRAR
jgi:hypothetical protein